jgi:aspartate dehydrogenase
MRKFAGMQTKSDLSARRRVAIAGLGPIGLKLAQALDRGIEGLELTAVAVGDPEKPRPELERLSRKPRILPLAELESVADIVVECAPAAHLREIIQRFVTSGKTAVVLSAGALLQNYDLVDEAKKNGGQIIVPTGALIGLDAVTAAAEGTIHSVRMVTRKPIKGLLGAPYVVANNIDLETFTEARKIFEGTAREGAKGFPANVNVAAALALAGIGPDRTSLEIWADPNLDRNMHRIEVDADSAHFSMEIANVPSENPKTGRITALSVIACLRKLNAPLRVGT